MLNHINIAPQEISEIETNFGVTFLKSVLTYFYIFSLDSNKNLFPAVKSIDSLSYVVAAECGFYGEYHALPNDPYYTIGTGNAMWHLKSTGFGVKVDSAWDITTGDSNIIVAVLDNGVDYYHPDLGMGTDGYENIYKNPKEDPWISPIDPVSGNGVGDSIDNDTNGYIDDWKGWNFYTNYLTGGVKDANYYSGSSIPPNNHGTPMAGIIAAKTNNGIGVSGVAGGWGNKGVQILPINLGPGFGDKELISALNYAIKMKADVVTMSFGIGMFPHMVIDSIITSAYDNGIVFTASTGNRPIAVQYPANSKRVLGVGAYEINGVKASYSSFGNNIDIVAPTDIYTTQSVGGLYGLSNGTSASTPIVAGIAALMKSVNPCISSEEIYEILKNTATKSGSYNYNWSSSKPGHSKQFGYGRVNAHEAVKLAQSTQSNTVDLYIKDDHEDFGVEPNIYSNIFYLSPDIWIRNLNDKKETHQNPEYDPVSPVYVNVKVRNKSCVSSSGTDTLYIHWNKAGTHLGWPGSWNGSTSSPMLGNVIDSIIIPVIPAGKDTILTLPWVIPNPQDYTSVASDVWHFCLLARIKSSTDLYHTPESSDFDANLKHNNNVALKNVTVVDSMSSVGGGSGGSSIRKYSGTIAVGNSFGEPKAFNFSFSSPNDDLVNVTDIVLEVDDALFTKLANSNTPPTFIEDNKILISENNFVLQNVDFAANEISTINLTFFFKSDVDITQDEFRLYVNQIDVSTSKVTGGELFVIYPKKDNADINADAGDDQTVNSDDQITLSADYVAGNVEYKWFDEEGNLVAKGMDLTVNIDASEMFQLIVFDLENGISDDDYVNVTVDDNEIKTISPNPTNTGQIQVEYNIDGSTNAYLMVVENGIIRNYVVTNTTSKIIQTNNFSNGTHTILLICDGVIKDVKQFIKI